MDKKQIIENVSTYIKDKQSGEGSGHDWWHTKRVLDTAKYLAQKEGADLFIVELAALFHDIADWKFAGGDDKASSKVATELLTKYGVDKESIDHVCHIVDNVSFKGEVQENKINTIEGKVVQDADRLDALGAIGIARVFAYGGHKGTEIYNPDIKFQEKMDFEKYKKNQGTSINHFYEKLLLLKDLINTKSAKIIAEERHQFMLSYLEEFYKEWNAKY
jgi:uncharacterized protein